MSQLLGSEQILPKLVAEVDVNLLKGTLAMYEVAEMEIDELPFLVMFVELLAVILQEIGFEFVLVEKIIPFIHNLLESAATDGFGFLGHYLVEVQLTLVSRIGIDINTKRLMADNFHRFLVSIPRIIIQIERQHPVLQRTCS